MNAPGGANHRPLAACYNMWGEFPVACFTSVSFVFSSPRIMETAVSPCVPDQAYGMVCLPCKISPYGCEKGMVQYCGVATLTFRSPYGSFRSICLLLSPTIVWSGFVRYLILNYIQYIFRSPCAADMSLFSLERAV